MPSNPHGASGSIRLSLILGGLILGIGATGYYYYATSRAEIRREVAGDLTSIAKEKATLISTWRGERIADASAAAAAAVLMPAVLNLLDGRATTADRASITTWMDALRGTYGYTHLAVADLTGHPLLQVGQTEASRTQFAAAANEAASSQAPVFRDFDASEKLQAPHVGVSAALRPVPGGEARGILLLEVDPETRLIPLIQIWPTSSPTAEAVLLRHEGTEVVLLTELRHQPGSKMLRTQVERFTGRNVRAVAGVPGTGEIFDYRGVPVVAAWRVVPGTNWIVGSKVDAAEVFAPLNNQARLLGLMLAALVLAVATTGIVIWRNQQAAHYEQQLESAKALRSATELLHAIVDSAPTAIMTLDPERVVTSWNRAAERVFGWSAEEIVGRQVPIVPAESEAAFRAQFQRVIDGETMERREVRRRRKDGTEIPLELTAAPLRSADGSTRGAVALLLDLSAQKQAEGSLQEIEDRWQFAVEGAEEGVWDWNVASGQVYYSRRWKEILGYLDDEISDSLEEWLSRIHPDDAERNLEAVQRHFRKEAPAYLFEYRARRKDGRYVWLVGRGKVIAWGEDGHPRRFVGTMVEVTQRKELEERLRQAQKMESVGRLAGGVAHDFNNHLTVIEGYSELLLAQLPPDSPYFTQVSEIRNAGQRAGMLTRQLLSFSRQQSPETRPLNLNEVIKDLEKMLRRLIRSDIELSTVLAPDVQTVRADPTQMQQVLMNLVVNARDALKDGGKLIIESSNVHLTDAYSAGQQPVKPGPYVLLTVSDTGCGMDEATVRQIFEPFFTTKGSGEGTGLGLCTVYSIVQQLGGWIWVYSEPGKGSTFKVYLPADGRPEQPDERAERPADALGTETILIAEDHDQVRAFSESVLRGLGYEVLTARDGEEALRVAAEHTGPLHLLLTDVAMPRMNGRDLARNLAAKKPGLKVLYISGYTANVIAQQDVVDEGLEFLPKPFTPDQLGEKVRSILGPPPEAK
ncbi:PAS domain S-box protein [Paludibaculum fermentans]|uniref:histidine kinase n=1 Tax=Paludibaculum fermentans TaxID=1473598 RepID=A0A7S7NJV6_PALFE|nr:PAS domain S-box protein [Paludibaculum fermentans]QOY84904.1 PAS domain S-box protein [Paludibaculum fermentans]